MNDQKPEKIEKPEELLRAEKLIDDAKANEANELLNNFERKEGLTLRDKVASHLLRADLLFQQGRYRESLTLAEETYKESLGLGKNLQSVDCIIHMANSLWLLVKIDKLFDVIIQGEELLKNLLQVSSSKLMKREAYLALLKAMFYMYSGKLDLVSNCLKQSQELLEKIDFKRLNAILLWIIAFIHSNRGELDLAFAFIKKGIVIAKESKNKYTIANCLYVLGGIYHLVGDWEKALKTFKECLSIYEELDNKKKMSYSLKYIAEIYRDFTDDYDRASEYIETSLAVYNEEVHFIWAGTRFYTAITIAIKKGDHEEAKTYLQDLKKINSQVKNKMVEMRYRLSKALILKSSSRFHDMVKAEKILREIINSPPDVALFIDTFKIALLNLFDILLAEFRVTNNLEILDELESLITHLLNVAEKTKSHSIRTETYLLQAKLALLSFDVKKSRRFLTQAQLIAERNNLNKLANEISSEHKNLVDNLELWEQLKKSKAPLSERFKLAQISEQMERVHRARVVATQIIEEKVTISKEKKICLVCRGEVLRFSYICECGANYCENCAKALSNLENVCWSCNVPIDYSKPSKPFNEEEEPIKVQEKAKKK